MFHSALSAFADHDRPVFPPQSDDEIMAERFAILHHFTDSGEHWDFLLERGDVLLTWRLARMPAGAVGLPVGAERVADHRKKYLDYEGPLTGGRGTVRRIDTGRVEFEAVTAEQYVFRLDGGGLRGRFCLRRLDDAWTLSVAEGI